MEVIGKSSMLVGTYNNFLSSNNIAKMFEENVQTGHQNEDCKGFNSEIQGKGFIVWMDIEGTICYRLSTSCEAYRANMHKASLVISNYSNRNIKITSLPQKKHSKDNDVEYIYTNDLPLVHEEVFYPLHRKEFFESNVTKKLYRNTYSPIKIFPYVYNFHMKSDTLCYIYYLAGRNEGRFNFIMGWLSSFFQDFNNRSMKKLVLIGDKKSGIDILFNEVITPLFQKKYCVVINEENFNINYMPNMLKEKLFIHLQDLSSGMFEDKISGSLLKKLILNNETIEINSRRHIEVINNYAQMLITVTKNNMPYIDNNDDFVVFNIHEELEKSCLVCDVGPNSRIFTKASRDEIIRRIRDDDKNFAMLMNAYSPRCMTKAFEDDRNCLHISKEKKLKNFVNAIFNKDIIFFDKVEIEDTDLYKSIVEGFEINRFYQPNMIKSFNIIYNDEKFESPRTFMSELRKINSNAFRAESIKSSSTGKYIEL